MRSIHAIGIKTRKAIWCAAFPVKFKRCGLAEAPVSLFADQKHIVSLMEFSWTDFFRPRVIVSTTAHRILGTRMRHFRELRHKAGPMLLLSPMRIFRCEKTRSRSSGITLPADLRQKINKLNIFILAFWHFSIVLLMPFYMFYVEPGGRQIAHLEYRQAIQLC